MAPSTYDWGIIIYLHIWHGNFWACMEKERHSTWAQLSIAMVITKSKMGFGYEFCRWQWRIRALSCRSPVGRNWGVKLVRSRAISMSSFPPMQSSVPDSLKEVCFLYLFFFISLSSHSLPQSCFTIAISKFVLGKASVSVLLLFLIVQRWMELALPVWWNFKEE